MDAVDFLKTKARMCKGIGCMGCELGSRKNGKNIDCLEFTHTFPEEATKIVEEWGKEHPAATNLQHVAEGLRELGYAVNEELLKKACPPAKSRHFTNEHIGCYGRSCDMCEKWWSEEYKENEE